MNWIQRKLSHWSKPKTQEVKESSSSLAKLYGDDLTDPDALIHRANKRATGGDIDGAFSDFDSAISISPARATAYYNRGFLHNTLGNFEEAIEDFNRVLDLLPDYDEAYYQRGNSRLKLNDLNNAEQDFSRALQINPYSIKSYYKRAETYAELGDTAGALADYAQAIARIPKDANAYYQRGRFLAKLGELQTSIDDFNQAIELNPRHADAYCSRGCCFAELGEMEKASQDFNQALLHNPSHQAAYYQRMYSLGILKENPVDLQQLNIKATDTNPRIPTVTPVTVSSETVAFDDEDDDDLNPTQPLISQTVKLEPESLDGFFERANKRALQGDLEGAIADYTTIIEQDPQNTQAYFRRGQNLSSLGDTEAAMADLNTAIHWTRVHSLGRLKDFNGALSETIETLKSELNKPKPSRQGVARGMPIEEAIAVHSETIAQNPDDADAYFKRGQSRALLGDLQGAIADYTSAIQLNPQHSDAHYRRGLSRAALGDSAGATTDLNRAILRKPSADISLPTPSSGLASGRPQNGAKPLLPGTSTVGNLNLNLNPSSYCNHAGNRPGNRFCVHCGETLHPPVQPGKVTNSQDTVSETALKTAIASSPASLDPVLLLEQGRFRCETGNVQQGLKDIGTALKVFLDQQNIPKFQEASRLIQQYSTKL